MRAVNSATTAVICLAAAACAPRVVERPIQPAEPTRSGLECDSVVVRVRAHPDSFRHVTPTPSGIVLPPRPPSGVRGKDISVRLRVDEKGGVDPAGVVIEGVSDTAYAMRLYERLLAYTFYPAILEGCAVPSVFRVTLRVG